MKYLSFFPDIGAEIAKICFAIYQIAFEFVYYLEQTFLFLAGARGIGNDGGTQNLVLEIFSNDMIRLLVLTFIILSLAVFLISIVFGIVKAVV